jgi:hypothetical protein
VTAAAPRRRLPKRTQQQTRDLMLRAAVDLIVERADATGDDVVAGALAHLRLTQVAERATQLVRAETGDDGALSITTGAIYQLWPSQPDFQADLLLHIAERESVLVPGLAESIRTFQEGAASGLPLEEVLSRTMERVFVHYLQDSLFRVQLSFLVSAKDPRVAAALAHRQRAFYVDADQAWQSLMQAYGLRPRHPYTVRHLAVAAAAQITGAVAIWYSGPESLRDPAGEEGWSLLSRMILGTFRQFTEPDPDKAR